MEISVQTKVRLCILKAKNSLRSMPTQDRIKVVVSAYGVAVQKAKQNSNANDQLHVALYICQLQENLH